MRVGYFVGLFCMTAFAFVACEKAGEDGGNKELRLTVDCSDLVADGVDKVTFTVGCGDRRGALRKRILDGYGRELRVRGFV